MRIGIVGLGRMGSAMAERLQQQGFEVRGWDQSDDVNSAHARSGLSLAQGPQHLVSDVEVIISAITDDAGAQRLFAGPSGLLATELAGKLFIEMSTLRPMTAWELVPLVQAKGARMIDAPVMGTVPHARNGTLMAIVGGEHQDIERARPVLEQLTRRIEHVGPNGSGYVMKLAVNLGLGAYIQALSESLALGTTYGLSISQMLDVLREAPYASGWLASKVDVLKGVPGDTTLDIRTLRKDIMSAVATGARSGIPMPLAAGTLAATSAAVAASYGAEDLARLPAFFREAMLQS